MKPSTNHDSGRQPQKPRKCGYSREIAERMFAEMAKGRSVMEICRSEPWAPPESTFRSWVLALPKELAGNEKEREWLAAEYARAMELRCDRLAEEALAVAHGATPETVQVARLDFDAKRWFLGKVQPKKYGDRVGLEHSGADGGPLKVQVELIGGPEVDQSGTK